MPLDLFAFIDFTRIVGNGNFADFKAHTQELCRDFRFPFEFIAFNQHGTDQRSVKCLVAGRFIRQIGVVEQIDPERQQKPAEVE